jgi:hypothetical protein
MDIIRTQEPSFQFVEIYKEDGATSQPSKFTALAAASLNTFTADQSKILVANISSNSVLYQETITEISVSETILNGIGVYGLGPHLYSQNDQNSKIIGHDGSGNNAINTAVRVDLKF